MRRILAKDNQIELVHPTPMASPRAYVLVAPAL